MEWWHLWFSLALALFSIAAFRGDRTRAVALGVILAGIATIQLLQEILVEAPMWVAGCLVWVVAGAAIQRQSNGQMTGISVMLVASGLCIPVGRMAGEAYSIGSYSLFASDVLGVAALVALGGPLFVGRADDIATRIRRLGGGLRGHILGSCVDYSEGGDA